MAKRDRATGQADFWGLARSFLHVHCPRVRGLSPRTCEAYRISLERLLEFLRDERGVRDEGVTFDAIDRACVRDWVVWMAGVKRYAPRTIGLRLTALRSFLAYCAGEDASLMDVYLRIRDVRGPSAPAGPVEFLGERELAALLGANAGATAKSRRDRMMLLMLFESAARVSELTGMELGDLSLARPAHVTVAGKGGKARTVPLGDACVAHLRVYLGEFHPGGPGADPRRPLFYSLHGGVPCALSTDTVARALSRAGDIAREGCPTIPERLHPHMVRKSRAMSLYRAGVPLPLIMQMLGHESMRTTSRFYAFATEDMMARAVADAAPALLSEESGWLTDERRSILYSLR